MAMGGAAGISEIHWRFCEGFFWRTAKYNKIGLYRQHYKRGLTDERTDETAQAAAARTGAGD